MVSERGGRMSKYLVNKFLFTVDRDPDLLERYREDPTGTVAWWEAEKANEILNLPTGERSTWLGVHRRGTHGARRRTTTSRCSRWARTRSSP